MTRKIALIPVYNEESTLLPVLQSVAPRVDLLVLVDDGSSDSSLKLAVEFARGERKVEVLLADEKGMTTEPFAGEAGDED